MFERVPLSNEAFEGANNAYLHQDADETALIDTGDGPAREQLTERLAAHGIEFADVDQILLTHWHHDHTELAGAIQEAGDATVRAHAVDTPLIEGDEAAWSSVYAEFRDYLTMWNVPDQPRAEVLEAFQDPIDPATAPSVTSFVGGETFEIGDVVLEAVHTPGHAAGHTSFVWRDRNEVFSGDALLPKYTPNVGGADFRVDMALERYVETLLSIVRAEYDTAWPGHRDPIDDPTARAREIITHHETRAWRVADVVARKPGLDTWEISAELFGDLEGIHILHGPGESHAHLEHLIDRDLVVRSDEDTFHPIDGLGNRLDAIDDERWPLVEWEPLTLR